MLQIRKYPDMHSILLPRMKQETFYPSPNGDEDNGKKYLGAAWALVAAATLSTGIRVWVRGRLTRNMGVC